MKDYVHEMRQIPSPRGVANVDGGSLLAPRMPQHTWRFGPFASIRAFHDFLHQGLAHGPKELPEVDQLIA